jgi:hypothetical protein
VNSDERNSAATDADREMVFDAMMLFPNPRENSRVRCPTTPLYATNLLQEIKCPFPLRR